MKVLMVPKMRDDYDMILQLASTNILKPGDMFTHPENGKKIRNSERDGEADR